MMDKLRYWSYKILPLVYDDSLSYYEVLGKMRAKINEVIDYISDTLANNIKEIMSRAFVDVTYDEATETITIYLNTEDV